MKPEQWIVAGETGISSKTIWAVMMGGVDKGADRAWYCYDVPHDPDDFSRCWKLLNLFPQWRQRLPEVAVVFPMWTGFVRDWDILTTMYESNLRTKGTGYSREMYDFMFQLQEEGHRADGWIYNGSPGSWTKPAKEV